jgi:hypothetical protein
MSVLQAAAASIYAASINHTPLSCTVSWMCTENGFVKASTSASLCAISIRKQLLLLRTLACKICHFGSLIHSNFLTGKWEIYEAVHEFKGKNPSLGIQCTNVRTHGHQ